MNTNKFVHVLSLALVANLLILTVALPKTEEAPKKEEAKAEASKPEEGETTPEELPTQLSVEIFGEGDCNTTTPAAEGDTLVVLYEGRILNTNEEFANKWDPEDPFVFKLGNGTVVEGWEIGLLGMCVGEKRVLTMPSELGYGEEGVPPTIPPNVALQYSIVLIDKQ